MTFHANVIIQLTNSIIFQRGSTVYQPVAVELHHVENISTTDADSSSFRGAFRGDSVKIRRSSPKQSSDSE